MQLMFIAALQLLSVLPQTLPNAAVLMNQVADAGQRHNSIQYVVESTMEAEMPNGLRPSEITKYSVAFLKPDRIRLEDGKSIEVSDGKTSWAYIVDDKQYTKTAGPLRVDSEGVPVAAILGGLPGVDLREEPKTVREETVVVDGTKRDCWVVVARINPPEQFAEFPMATWDVAMTVWIDKAWLVAIRGEVLLTGSTASLTGATVPSRAVPFVSARMKWVMLSVRFDEPIPAERFTFVPPRDAAQVARLSANDRSQGPTGPTPQARARLGITPLGRQPGMIGPQPLMNSDMPRYSIEAQRAGVQGIVLISTVVRKDGSVEVVEVLQRLGSGLDEAALAAIKTMKFRPATQDGTPVDANVNIRVEFTLQ